MAAQLSRYTLRMGAAPKSRLPFASLPALTAHRPQKEFTKVAKLTGIGFLAVGLIGFVVKVIFIPINQVTPRSGGTAVGPDTNAADHFLQFEVAGRRRRARWMHAALPSIPRRCCAWCRSSLARPAAAKRQRQRQQQGAGWCGHGGTTGRAGARLLPP